MTRAGDRGSGPDPLEVRRMGRIEYGEALRLQESLVEERKAGAIPDQLLLLEHPHVITRGTSAEEAHLLADEEERRRLGIALFDVGRGGDVTYHGPGQLIGYPILDLRPDRKDLHRYLRDLEEVIIRTLRRLGIRGRRVEGYTGVWVDERKVAAIGVRVSSPWITSHGFALNVHTDLRYFETIVPCGIADRRVTSLAAELGRPVSLKEVHGVLAPEFATVFERKLMSSSQQVTPDTKG